ncbi:MAG: cobalt-precorrin-5B (C(1))-methyltransferase [Lawsonibacter sp.]
MPFEHYVTAGGKRLAVVAIPPAPAPPWRLPRAARLLLTGRAPETVSLRTPKGWVVEVPVEAPRLEAGAACCCVTKDGGDDVDATHGLPVCARVEAAAGEAVLLQGGPGVGRVTRPGLDQPMGEWAINRVLPTDDPGGGGRRPAGTGRARRAAGHHLRPGR